MPAPSSPAAVPPSLEAIPGLWRGGRPAQEGAAGTPTGFPALDRELPGGGWPAAGLTELHCDAAGVGEMRLLGPALRSMAAAGRTIVLFTSPTLARLPVLPYAPALTGQGIDLAAVLVVRPESEAQVLWSIEQVLRAGAASGIGACIAWLTRVPFPALRRLQLASGTGGAPAFLFRPESQVAQASPAPLRLQLAAGDQQLAVRILKRRGAWLDRPILLPLAVPGAVPLPVVPDVPAPVDRAPPAPTAARPDRATAAAA